MTMARIMAVSASRQSAQLIPALPFRPTQAAPPALCIKRSEPIPWQYHLSPPIARTSSAASCELSRFRRMRLSRPRRDRRSIPGRSSHRYRLAGAAATISSPRRNPPSALHDRVARSIIECLDQKTTQRRNRGCQRYPAPQTTGSPTTRGATTTGGATTTPGTTGSTTTPRSGTTHTPLRSRNAPGPQPPATGITSDVAWVAANAAAGAAGPA